MPYSPGITYDTRIGGAAMADAGQNILQGIKEYRHKREQHDLARAQAETALAQMFAQGPDGAQAAMSALGEKLMKSVSSGEAKITDYLAAANAIGAWQKQRQEEQEFALRQQVAQAQIGNYQAQANEAAIAQEGGRQTSAALSAMARFGHGRPLWPTGENVGLNSSGAATPDLTEAFGAAITAFPQSDPSVLLRGVSTLSDMQPRSAGMNTETMFETLDELDRRGWSASGQINPNGTAGIGGLQRKPAPPATTATPILTDDGKPTGKAVTPEGKVIDLSPPNSEGKTLTQTEVDRISALSQAENDLKKLKAMYSSLGKGYGGPVAGRLKSMAYAGQNPDISALNNAIVAATPNLARGVFREVGVLTDADVRRYQQLLPAPTDTESVRQNKMDQLEKRLEEGKREIINTLRKAGRDVTAFEDAVSLVSGGQVSAESAPIGSKSVTAPTAPAPGAAPKARKFNPATNRIE